MDADKVEYDAATSTLTYRSGVAGAVLLDKAVGAALGKVSRSGSYEGREVKEVCVDFADEAAARYNADALGFLTLVPTSGGVRYATASFSTREDFGIAPKE